MANKQSIFSGDATGAEKVAAFLSKAGVFYLGTTDGDQPKIRAFSWFDYQADTNRLIFSTGGFKNVCKQMTANPKVEIFAHVGMYFLRLDGTVKFLDDDNIREQVKHDSPGIAKTYQEHGWQLQPFTIENGHVEVRYSLEPVEEFDV